MQGVLLHILGVLPLAVVMLGVLFFFNCDGSGKSDGGYPVHTFAVLI